MEDEHTVIDTEDGGWLSRKFLLIIFAMLLITGGGLLSMYSPVFLELYATFIGGILGAVGLYFTSNVSHKFLAGKVNASVKMEAMKYAAPEPSNADLNHEGGD